MADENVVNTVIMGFAITVIVILAIKIFNKSKEQKDNLTVTGRYTDDDDPIDPSQLPPYRPIKKIKLTRQPKYCPPNEYEDINTALARDIVIGKKLEQPQKEESFTRKEIKDYQNRVFAAEDYFNYSSKNAISAHDRVNEMVVTQGNELCGEVGQSIANVFDKITRNNFQNN